MYRNEDELSNPFPLLSERSGSRKMFCATLLCIFFLNFFDKVLLCSSGWSSTHDLPISTSRVLELQLCAIVPRFFGGFVPRIPLSNKLCHESGLVTMTSPLHKLHPRPSRPSLPGFSSSHWWRPDSLYSSWKNLLIE